MRKQRSLSVCLCIVLLETCTSPSFESLHYEVVRQDHPHNNDSLQETFEKWEEAGGLLIPESTFTVYKTSHESLCITTPDSWKGNALQAKAELKKTFLHNLTEGSFIEPTNSERGTGKYHLFVDGKEIEPKSAPAHHALCLVDLSGNVNKEDALAVMNGSFTQWLSQSEFAPSSPWRCVLVGRTRDTAQLLGTIVLGNSSPAYEYLSAHEKFQAIKLPQNVDQRGSAIIEAMHYGVSLFGEAGIHPQRITVFSDLRQRNHVFDLSQNIPSIDSFSSWLKSESMMMDLHTAEIEVIGISHTTSGTGEYTAKDYDSLVSFWKTLLTGMNATSVSIRSLGRDL